MLNIKKYVTLSTGNLAESSLMETSYENFRSHIGTTGWQKQSIYHINNSVLILDAKNILCAVVQMAGIDAQGQSRPIRYFVPRREIKLPAAGLLVNNIHTACTAACTYIVWTFIAGILFSIKKLVPALLQHLLTRLLSTRHLSTSQRGRYVAKTKDPSSAASYTPTWTTLRLTT